MAGICQSLASGGEKLQTVPDELPNQQGPFALSVRYHCSGTETTDDIGRFDLYDPLISPVVGVPPAVTDLDVSLTVAKSEVYLPLVVKD